MGLKLCVLVLLIIVQIFEMKTIGSTAEVNSNRDFKIVCNFDRKAWHTQGDRKYTLDLIDEKLCTHIVLSNVEMDQMLKTAVTYYKKIGIPVLMSIDNGVYERLPDLLSNTTTRAHFVSHVSELIQMYNFDGLELHLEHPPGDDKHQVTDLVRELSEAFKWRNLLLSIFVSPWPSRVNVYDVSELSEYVDWFSIRTYGYNGDRGSRHAGHFAAFNDVTSSIQNWINEGAPKEKILMGLPSHGANFVLKDVNQHDVGAKVEYRRHEEHFPFFEVLQKLNSSYSVVHDEKGTYAYFGRDWLTYDDVKDIERKAQYIRQMNLGGAFVSEINGDDFRGDSNKSCGKYPLLTAANKVLRNFGDSNINLRNCS